MDLLVFTTLFPNAAQPVHGVFVENRLRHLLATGQATARVVAPVPWFPSAHPAFGRYAAFARAPAVEERGGVAVVHPRYPALPKVGMTVAPYLLYRAVKRLVARLVRGARPDVIDAHYFYPDGVAAVLLGQALDLPVTITARGTDINLIPEHPLARAQILWAARRAAGLVTVCEALRQRLIDLGVPGERILTLRNGVDLVRFRPRDRTAVRQRLGLAGTVLLSVGLLIERKGHHLAIGALPGLPGATLLIAGEGPERARLEALATRLGVGGRVRFLGQVAHDDLPELYSAADAMILASSREGWANVLLEAMACGTPVVATDVWGTAEAVADPAAGVLVPELTPEALADGVRRLMSAPPPRPATRAYAERFGWEPTTAGQLALFRRVVADHAAAAPAGKPPSRFRTAG